MLLAKVSALRMVTFLYPMIVMAVWLKSCLFYFAGTNEFIYVYAKMHRCSDLIQQYSTVWCRDSDGSFSSFTSLILKIILFVLFSGSTASNPHHVHFEAHTHGDTVVLFRTLVQMPKIRSFT